MLLCMSGLGCMTEVALRLAGRQPYRCFAAVAPPRDAYQVEFLGALAQRRKRFLRSVLLFLLVSPSTMHAIERHPYIRGLYTVGAGRPRIGKVAFYGLCIVDGDTEEEKQDTRRKRFRRCAERAQELT